MDCNPPGSSVHGIFQARILECVAISSSRGSFGTRDLISISCVSFIGRWILLPLVPPGRPIQGYRASQGEPGGVDKAGPPGSTFKEGLFSSCGSAVQPPACDSLQLLAPSETLQLDRGPCQERTLPGAAHTQWLVTTKVERSDLWGSLRGSWGRSYMWRVVRPSSPHGVGQGFAGPAVSSPTPSTSAFLPLLPTGSISVTTLAHPPKILAHLCQIIWLHSPYS